MCSRAVAAVQRVTCVCMCKCVCMRARVHASVRHVRAYVAPLRDTRVEPLYLPPLCARI